MDMTIAVFRRSIVCFNGLKSLLRLNQQAQWEMQPRERLVHALQGCALITPQVNGSFLPDCTAYHVKLFRSF